MKYTLNGEHVSATIETTFTVKVDKTSDDVYSVNATFDVDNSIADILAVALDSAVIRAQGIWRRSAKHKTKPVILDTMKLSLCPEKRAAAAVVEMNVEKYREKYPEVSEKIADDDALILVVNMNAKNLRLVK